MLLLMERYFFAQPVNCSKFQYEVSTILFAGERCVGPRNTKNCSLYRLLLTSPYYFSRPLASYEPDRCPSVEIDCPGRIAENQQDDPAASETF